MPRGQAAFGPCDEHSFASGLKVPFPFSHACLERREHVPSAEQQARLQESSLHSLALKRNSPTPHCSLVSWEHVFSCAVQQGRRQRELLHSFSFSMYSPLCDAQALFERSLHPSAVQQARTLSQGSSKQKDCFLNVPP